MKNVYGWITSKNMLKLYQLSTRQLKSHLRFVRLLPERGQFFCGETSFRVIERLHKAGLVDVYVSKWNFFGGRRPFRELFVQSPGRPNECRYPIMPKR